MDGDTPPYSRSFEPLTRREREILMLLGQGLSDREIAERLFIAYTTVKWHNRQIFNKLGVESRKQAVERANSFRLMDSHEAHMHFKQALPAQLTPFVGRSDELSELQRWLNYAHTRLITILAPGGMGKTRLAVEVARSVLDDYADGVCFVPLVGLTSSELLIFTLIDALALQFPPDGRSPSQQLFDALRRKHLLLVLDNFEHLLDSASQVADLLMAAPNVSVLVTSRERLNITGELVYSLTGLETADSAHEEAVISNSAGQLFFVCAQRANPHFVSGDMRGITRLCRLVQGMPLAIELAAAWASTLSPAEIADEVTRSADFLKTSQSDVPERLRSVRIVFEAAWAHLTDEAQQVFRRMAVFRGGCTREAAQVVTGADVTTLATLVDKALLWRNTQSERFEIHELLRQYAEQQLEAVGEAALIRRAHQQYYAQLAKTAGEALQADKMLEGLAMLDADDENVRVALAQATLQATSEAIEPFTDLWFYYDLRSKWAEGDQALIAAGNAIEPHDSVALSKLLTGRSILYERTERWTEEFETGKRGYEMARRLDAPHALPLAMIAYGDALRDLSQHDEALPIYQEGFALSKDLGLPLMRLIFTFHLANDAENNGRIEEAVARMTDAYAGAAKLNNLWAMCFCKQRLAYFALFQSDMVTAQRLFEDILSIARAINFNFMIDLCLSGLSVIARQRGDWQAVYRLSLETLRMRYETATNSQIVIVLVTLAEAALMLNDLEEVRHRVTETLRLLSEQTMAADVLRAWFQTQFTQLLFAAGGLLARTGDYARAVTVLSCLEQFIVSNDLLEVIIVPFTRLVPEFLRECRVALSPEVFDVAAARGMLLSFEDALAELSLIY